MVLFAGKYKHVESENVVEFLKLVDVEITQEKIDTLNGKFTTVFVEECEDKYTITTTIGLLWQRIIRFTVGKKFNEGDCETIPTKDGNKLIFMSSNGIKTFRRIYEFHEWGLIVTLDTDYGGHAVRTYERV